MRWSPIKITYTLLATSLFVLTLEDMRSGASKDNSPRPTEEAELP